MVAFFKIVLYQPLLNALVLITALVPGGDVGVAIIFLTIVVKILLIPLSTKALETQEKMRDLEPKLRVIREKYKNDKRVQAERTMELYKTEGMNPLSGLMLTIIQIPILIALYFVFSHGLPFKPELLYSFVHLPAQLQFLFLGFIDLAKENYPLAIISGVSQFFQMQLAVPPLPKKDANHQKTLSDDFARSMNMNMRYVMPVMIAIIGLKLPSAIVLYWVTNNLFMIGHELIRRRKKRLALAHQQPQRSKPTS